MPKAGHGKKCCTRAVRFMAWESRGSGQYYYKARREGGRVVKEYLGSGEHVAELVTLEAESRKIRQLDAEIERFRLAEADDRDALLSELNAAADLLARAALLAAGYRQHHRGEWRKPRG